MPTPKMHSSGTRLSVERLNQLQSSLGVALPADYTEFLLAHNGGAPEPALFCADQSWGGSLLDYFYTVDAPDDLTDLETYTDVVRDDVDRTDIIAIAIDQGGNYVCLDVGDEAPGAVYFVSHDEPEGDNVWKIAESFTAFLNSFDI